MVRFVFILLSLLASGCYASEVPNCEFLDRGDQASDTQTSQKGCFLLQDGWQKIADCHDGHQWSYVLQKEGGVMRCNGINSRGGPTEDPCVEFEGDLKGFKDQKPCWAVR